jgi:transposase
VEAELVAARATRDQLAAEFERLRVDNQRLRARVGELAAQVEQLRRASKRQAAPFSKGTTVPRPRRPGRKACTAYGHHARRSVPDPDRVVAPDETGWRVGGRRAWLWAFAGDGMTVYRIAAGRGFDDATTVLGADDAGVLERDGWAPYRRFTHAAHQSCLAHLLRRCDELLVDAQRGQAKTPHAVRRILQQALAVRDARDAGRLDTADTAVWAERLGAAVDKLIAGRTAYPPNRRLLDHLGRERPALFTFLGRPGVQATNWRAEHAIRPAVVCRKQWGGNATWNGART